jgi:hypothetical protein
VLAWLFEDSRTSVFFLLFFACKIMKKSCLIALFGLIFLGGISLAQAPTETFDVVVNPSSFQVNQPVDLTITAKKNGEVNTAYTGMVWLTIRD